MSRPEWIEVGRISRPHGLQGEVRVLPSSDNPERFAPASALFARPERLGIAGQRLRERVRLTVRTVRGEGSLPIVAFFEVCDRAAAETLRGYLLEVRATELPELEEDMYYPFDLIDLEARDCDGVVIGRVSDVVESPAHGLLIITSESGPEIMVPFVLAAVPVVAVAEGFVTIAPGFTHGPNAINGIDDPCDGDSGGVADGDNPQK